MIRVWKLNNRNLQQNMPKKLSPITFWMVGVLILTMMTATLARVQEATPSPSPKKEGEAKKIEQEVEKIFRVKPRRPSVSKPADFNTSGVLQIEYGYGGYYRGRDFLAQHVGTLTVSYAATERIGFGFALDMVSSQFDRQRIRTTGIGDARLGVQFDIADESNKSPSFAVSYFAKLPSASVAKNLGTGRVDHAVSALFSKKVGGFDVDFNTALLINGKQGEKGFVGGGQFAFGVSRELNKKLNLQTEIYGESKDADEPQGLFAVAVFDYRFNRKMNFSVGLKFGLTANSPRVGVVAGLTYAFNSFFKKDK